MARESNSEIETGTRPETTGQKTSCWKKMRTVLRVIMVRARFLALFVGTAAVFIYWDTIVNYYDKWTHPTGQSAASSSEEFYCPMCPSVLREEPATCPICMMPLSKRKKTAKQKLPEGVLARVDLQPHQMKLAGIRVVPVSHQALVKTIRTTGFVEVDERRLARIAARVDGRIEKVHVDFTGKTVVADAPLVDIYSPELSVVTQELILAGKYSSSASKSLIEGAKEKLSLLGMSDRQIERIVQSKQKSYTLTIPAPRGGVVLKKSVVEGQYVKEGSPLYEIADLSAVWLKARIYEDQLPYVSLDQEVEAVCSAHPGKIFAGKVAFTDPVVDRATRTINVRFDLDNRNGLLRPGMNVTVMLKVPMTKIEPFQSQVAAVKRGPAGTDDASMIAYQKICPVTKMKLGSMGKPTKMKVGSQMVYLCCKGCEHSMKKNPNQFMPSITSPPIDGVLAIPSSAVIDTGARKVVYRESKPGVFEAIEVRLGPRVDDHYPVVSGLYPTDRIAGAGSFLIDAETRLNPAAASAYFGATGGPDQNRTATSASTKIKR